MATRDGCGPFSSDNVAASAGMTTFQAGARSNVKTMMRLIRHGLRAWGREARNSDGVLALVIAIALIAAAAALIATTARQNKEAEVARLSGNAKSVKLIQNSIVAFFLTDPDGGGAQVRNGRIPCPDSDQDGDADGTTSCTTTEGTLPWLTLGLSRDDVIDAYGNYFTYAVSGTDSSRQVCTYIESDLDDSQSQFTGSANEVTDTEVRLATQSAGQGTPYYYAIISHGKNGLGAISSNGNIRSAPTSAAERQNCPSAASCSGNDALVIYSGPQSTDQSSYFDDSVFVGSTDQLTELCETLSPSGEANADISEDFTSVGDGALPTSLSADVSGGGSAGVGDSTVSGSNDRVLIFSGGSSPAVGTVITTFNTAERAQYISFEWSPTTLGTGGSAGISVATRATVASRNAASDIYGTGDADGLTFRFFTSGTDNSGMSGGVNQIFICDSETPACNAGDRRAISGNFNIIEDTIYNVEVYDDGVQVWARITQTDDTDNTASVFFASYPDDENDLGGDNAIGVINNGDSTSEIDDFLVARGSMGVAFNGNDSIISAGDNHNTTTGNLTLEAWIKPDSLPAANERATIIAKWEEDETDAAQSYRLYLRTNGGVSLELSGGTTPELALHNFGGYAARVGRWDHIAVTYDRTEAAAKLYVNRALISRISSAGFDTEGINEGTTDFSVGATTDGTDPVDVFHGAITDVRVWDVARTAEDIFANYDRRIALSAGSLPNLIVNWTMDRDTSSAFDTLTVAPTLSSEDGANGTLADAAFVGIHQRHFPIFASSTVCAVGGAQGAIVNPYQCDYRIVEQSGTFSVPSNLASVYVKAWGGGGGGYDFNPYQSDGGGGGFSAARLTQINNEAIAGQTLNVDVGGGASASASQNNGAGGGGASGIWRNTVPTRAGVVAGGGGGAAFGDDNFNGQVAGFTCTTIGQCGPGGGGGGPANLIAAASTTRAADNGQNLCGGRGGNTTDFLTSDRPPDPNSGGTGTCESGGANPSNASGATGGGSNSGGASGLGPSGATASGGAGYNGGMNRVGGGGGGGGANNSTITSGGGEAGGYSTGGSEGFGADGNRSGFGGGGGGGYADDSTLNLSFSGAAGSTPAAGGASDPDYAPSYISGCGSCASQPGRGGEPGVNAAGRAGAVIIKW